MDDFDLDREHSLVGNEDECYVWDAKRGAAVGPFASEKDAAFWVREKESRERGEPIFVMSGPLNGYPVLAPEGDDA